MSFSAFLDTCVLVPSRQRDLLLELAANECYRPLWSAGVENELSYTIKRLHEARKNPPSSDQTQEYITKLLSNMRSAFPDAKITLRKTHSRIDASNLPDPNDAHIIDAAVAGRADLIVTDNVKDFPRKALPHGISAKTADEFLCDLLSLHEAITRDAITTLAGRTGVNGPSLTVTQLLDLFARNTPAFASEAKQLFFSTI